MKQPLVATLLVLLGAPGAYAQAPTSPPVRSSDPLIVRVGAAGGLAGTTVGGETSNDGGVLLTGLIGIPVSGRTALALDITVQPFKADNPAREEAFTAVYVLAGLEVGLGQSQRAFVRPELGAVSREWSGTDVWQPSETSIAIGAVFGYSIWAGRMSAWGVEGGIRLSGAEDLSSILASVGVSYTLMGATH